MTSQIIVIASHNQGKIKEINDLCAPLGYVIASAGDYNLTEPIEDGVSFKENALIKARYCAEKTNQLSLSDDSGFCVDALDGDPGLYSARWAGETKDFNKAMDLVEQKWRDKNTHHRACHFVCALALVDPIKKQEYVFEGRVDGMLTFPKIGDFGFGYDAIFTPDGYNKTFAQMQPAEKHAISHRAHAFEQLKEFLTKK